MQPGDGQDVREPGAGVAFAHRGIELGGAGDDERINEGGTGPEQPCAAPGDAVAQRAATTRRSVEYTRATHQENPAIGLVPEPAARDEPRGAAVRGVLLGPSQRQGPAARRGQDVALDDSARGDDGIVELHDRGAGEHVFPCRARPHTRAGGGPFAQRRGPPQCPGDEGDPGGAAHRRPSREDRGAEQHAPRRETQVHAVQRSEHTGAKRDRDPENRRAHRTTPASGYTWTGFAPQRGANPTLRKPSSSATSSFAFS